MLQVPLPTSLHSNVPPALDFWVLPATPTTWQHKELQGITPSYAVGETGTQFACVRASHPDPKWLPEGIRTLQGFLFSLLQLCPIHEAFAFPLLQTPGNFQPLTDSPDLPDLSAGTL